MNVLHAIIHCSILLGDEKRRYGLKFTEVYITYTPVDRACRNSLDMGNKI